MVGDAVPSAPVTDHGRLPMLDVKLVADEARASTSNRRCEHLDGRPSPVGAY